MKTAFFCRHAFARVYGLIPLIALTSIPAWGQGPVRSFDELELKLHIGDTVQAIDDSGKKIQGRIADISASSLVLTVKTTRLVLPEKSIQTVKKLRHDPWWNGALIGGGIGAIAGLIITRTECGESDPECSAIAGPAFILPGMGIGAVAGALLDKSVKKFDTVYSAPRSSTHRTVGLSPIISRNQKGLHLSVSF
jgi:hypothetical protein